MASPNKILVVEDELTNAILLKRLLSKAGYHVVVAHNGSDALHFLEVEKFDALLTDWMMPQMDGIELIRQARSKMEKIPFVVMITALISDGARTYALESGADDFIAKPIDVDEILTCVKDGISRHRQEAPAHKKGIVTRESDVLPSFPGVVIGTSTGGPPTLIEAFRNIPDDIDAAFYVVQHGPPWMLETFSQRLQRETKLKVNLGINGISSEPGNIYIAPGEKHMRVEKDTLNLIVDDGPKENFVRPSADPLFRSAADAFGQFCVGAVLTGLGRDGSLGAVQLAGVKAEILVQDPETAVAPSMPNTVIHSGIDYKLVSIDKLSSEILKSTNDKIKKLKKAKSGK